MKFCLQIFVAAALLFAASEAMAAESLQERLDRTGLLHFSDCFPAPANLHDRHQEMGPDARWVLAAPPTVSLPNLTADAAGKASLAWEGVPQPGPHATGWWVESQFALSAYQVEQRKRVHYDYVGREALEGVLELQPEGAPTGLVGVRLREAWPVTQRLESPEIQVPAGARIHFAIALQSDWRAERDCGAVFRLLAEHDGATDTLFEKTLNVADENYDGPMWRDQTIDLQALSGKQVRFVFETENAPGAPEPSLAFPLWGAPVLFAPAAKPDDSKSLIVISLDTLRADHLGCYGHERPTSPHIDALAQESVLFEEARATASMTTPSHASVFTGLSPVMHRAGIFSEGYVLEPRWTTFAALMHQAGYATAAFTEGVALRGGLGFYQGFDSYSDGPPPGEPRTRIAEARFKLASDWIDRHGKNPFVLFVHTYEIHAPYDPPQEWVDKFVDPGYDGFPVDIPEQAKGEKQQRHVHQRYEAGIAYTDEQFGRFIEHCRKTGVLDRAHVVVLSDHGEEFWEHGGVGHAKTLYREQLHVPLIIRPAGGLESPKRIPTPVQLTDVFSTVLDLAGIPGTRPETSISLAPFLGGSAAAYPRERCYAYYKGPRDETALPDGNPLEWDMMAVEAGGRKRYLHGITEPGEPETAALPAQPTENALFDVQSDPREQHNLREAHLDEADALDALLLEWLTRELEARKAAADAADRSLEQSDVDALRALGYL
ncbi:MAG: sulfatase-like hydrolase/transferase [Candidatus Hydrogenedens sp.]|nr:sulfatase-like hydrolase/transferase [Candidatus Hydrogenedens sp.]